MILVVNGVYSVKHGQVHVSEVHHRARLIERSRRGCLVSSHRGVDGDIVPIGNRVLRAGCCEPD